MNPFKAFGAAAQSAGPYLGSAATGALTGAATTLAGPLANPVFNFAARQPHPAESAAPGPNIGVRLQDGAIPAGRIGVGPAPAQPGPRPFQPVQAPNARNAPMPIPGDFMSHDPDALREVVLGDLHGLMEKAAQSGDREALYDLIGQRGALDHGGFQGLTRYRQEAASEKAQREHLNRTNQTFSMMSPDDAWGHMMDRTNGDQEAAAAAAQRARLFQAEATAKATGQPAHYDPADTSAALARKYPAFTSAFSVDESGRPEIGPLSAMHAKLLSQGAPGLDDPNSEFARLASTRIRQMYGDTLDDQLALPIDLGPLPNPFGIGSWAVSLANRLSGSPHKMVAHDNPAQQLAAIGWWNKINAPPAP